MNVHGAPLVKSNSAICVRFQAITLCESRASWQYGERERQKMQSRDRLHLHFIFTFFYIIVIDNHVHSQSHTTSTCSINGRGEGVIREFAISIVRSVDLSKYFTLFGVHLDTKPPNWYRLFYCLRSAKMPSCHVQRRMIYDRCWPVTGRLHVCRFHLSKN